MNNTLIIDKNDNTAIALVELTAGSEVHGVVLTSNIPNGHKFALKNIKTGDRVIKYGYPIGHATQDIEAGSHIHTHNLKTNLKGVLEYTYEPVTPVGADVPVRPTKHATFSGFVRSDGSVGIRNEIWVINLVGCTNKPAEKMVETANKRFAENMNGIDGIYTFVHPYGCSQLGGDHLKTQTILANMVHHPNAGGVLVFGLGCENNNIPEFKKVLGEYDPARVKFLNAQDVDDEIEDGVEIIKELIDYAKTFKRQPVGLDNLVIGLKCGGSDGFSGITANPLVGRVSDMLIDHGGTALLTEVPEMFGAETILMNRCETPELFNKTVALINEFKEYFIRYNQEVYENPSPGNKDGGISTLEDKSLGCTQKGGTSLIKGVLAYGERVKTKGLNLLDGPGNDIVAITNMMASGAHIILFTTGRGTPVGAPVPTLKISSNSQLAAKKPTWVDYNAGTLLEGKAMAAAANELFAKIISVANGEQAQNEISGYREISIFKDGVTL